MTSTGTEQFAQQAVNDALAGFLAAPPPGTPAEVLELLGLMTASPGTPLPPRLYFEAVEQAPVAISITDPRANILYANGAFETLTGYARADVLGKNESILSSQATPASIYRHLWRTIQQKRTWSGTLVNRMRDGQDYVAALTVSPVLDRAGEVAYFLGMHRNVTREHQLEVQLRQQKLRIETVLDAAPVLVVLFDDTGKVCLDNHEYKKLLGDLRGREPLEVLRRALQEQAGFDALAVMRAGRGFKDVEVSVEIPGSGGPRWFSCSGTPASEADLSARGYFARQDGERRLLLLANDITAQRREVERAHLENLRARLAEQQMIQGMREALRAALYQLQGPLNLVQAAQGMLGPGSGGLAPVLAQLAESGGQALAALEAALPEEEREPGALVNVNGLLRQVLELETDRLLAAGIVVDWQPAAVLPSLRGHKTQLRSLFKHLIDNAILALSEAAGRHRELHVATHALEDAVEVVVADNGAGIAAEDRFKVFEPFYVGWRNRRGHAGMGLALSQEIVNAHGGSIAIDCGAGQGCLLRVVLRTIPESA